MAARRIGTALREILNSTEPRAPAPRLFPSIHLKIKIHHAARGVAWSVLSVGDQVAIEARAMAVRGSCLCGSVCFEVDLPFDQFVNCHCSRCRKATGTARSSNAVVQPNAVRWLSGEEVVSRYDLPTARSFATAFCRTCGSPLPHLTRSGRQMIIPAGTFDEPLDTSPDRHVHWRSRANWYEHGERLSTSE
jgi:hypothetical protein